MTGRATVYDVAKQAGVSIKTVSRVVNGSEEVKAATRDRVLSAVRDLKYVPNSHALSLKSGSTRTVGVVVDSLSDPFFAAIVAFVEQKLAAAGYTVLVAATNRNGEREREQVMALAGHRIAGLVLTPTNSDHSYLSDVLHGIPLVIVDRTCDVTGTDVVKVDDFGATRQAVLDLIALGHRRIAFVGDSSALPTNHDRHEGYLAAHEEAGIEVDAALERWDSDQTDQAAAATTSLLQLQDPPTAFFACHPRGAAGTVQSLHRNQQTHRAVISFGEVLLGDLLQPALTVIDHLPERIAEATADILLRRLIEAEDGSEPRPPTETLVPLALIRRGSGELTP